MNPSSYRGYVFGECTLDLAEKSLVRNGQPVALPPKVFDTLVLLVENAGHLVEKEEFMQKLWPGTYVGEDALTRNISILRKILGGTNGSQTRIVTVPTRGYRLEGQVHRINGQDPQFVENHAVTTPPLELPEDRIVGTQHVGQPTLAARLDAPAHRSWRAIGIFALTAIIVGTSAGMMTFRLLSPAPQPRVTHVEQLTHSGRVDPWPRLVTDGASIYHLERQGDHWNLMRTSAAGGQSQMIPTPFKNAVALDVSPDGANLLLGSFEHRYSRIPIWTWPVSGGAFRRLGDINAYAALWHPNGQQIVYSEDDGVYICDVDGANARKLVATDSYVGGWAWSWSPDGKTLRFMTGSKSWEMDSSGKVLRNFANNTSGTPNELGGRWSYDGRYFFVPHIVGKYRKDIWGVREPTLFHWVPAEPIRLTDGPMTYEGMVPSKTTSKLFVAGGLFRGDTVAFDPKSRQGTALLTGICAAGLTYSPDGEWIACRSADGVLLRMKPDGSERLVLADASTWGFDVRWSPDGKQLTFNSLSALGESSDSAIFVVPLAGATPRKLLPGDYGQSEGTWSPDGKCIAFARRESASSTVSIWILTLGTGQLSLVPRSENIEAPSWSPDGRFIAALADDRHKLMLFDTRTQEWSALAQGASLNAYGLNWSRDGRFLYFQDLLGKNEAVYRFHMDKRKADVVASFESLLRNGIARVALTSIAPDGLFIVDVDRGGCDIYALTLSLP